VIVFAFSAAAQPISIGIKGGVPLQDAFSIKSAANSTQFTVGPMVELRLPAGLGVEADVLYNRYDFNYLRLASALATGGSTSSSLEIPILLKYKFGGAPLIHPYVEGGPSFRKLFSVVQGTPAIVNDENGKGFALGVGIEFHALILRISPEIRWTHWGTQRFQTATSVFEAKQSQAQFLVGLSW
jgi:hypothetical protein